MLLFLDGMAHYGTAELGMKYSTVDTAHATLTVVPEGRFGNCIKRVGGDSNGDLEIAPFVTRSGLWTPTVSGVCGFALKIDDLRTINETYTTFGPRYSPHDLVSIVESGFQHLNLGITQAGTFVLRGQDQTFSGFAVILAQSIEGIQSDAWAYIECKWVIHPTAGTFELRVNAIPILSFTGNTFQFDTIPGGGPVLPGKWNSVRFLGVPKQSGTTLTLRMGDLYLADLVATLPADVSDFLGDGVVDTIIPNGVGASAAWTPSAGANWDTVNDRPAPDGDATYVRALAPGLKDVHQFEDIPIGSQVKGIHVNILARKEGEGGCAIAPIVHQGSTDYVGPTQGVASPLYDRYVTQPWDLNPATNAKFTDAEINAGQFGVVKVT